MAGETTFQLTEADFVAVYRDSLRAHGGLAMRDAGIISAAILLLLLLDLLADLALPRLMGRMDVLDVLPFAMGGLAWLWLCLGLGYVRARPLAQRIFRQRVSYQRPLSYGWSDEGLSFRTSHGAGLIPWSDLYRCRATEHNFLFLTDELSAYFIPRSALDEAQARDLEATLIASGAPVRPVA